MRKDARVVALAIIFLFFIQFAGTLVESIYILDLLRSGLDEKALGILFFFSPILILPFFRKRALFLPWILFAALSASRSLLPFLTTANRAIAAGIGTCATMSLLLLLISTEPETDAATHSATRGAAAIALAVCLSAMLRAVGEGIEYSLVPAGAWVGPTLCLVLGWALASANVDRSRSTEAEASSSESKSVMYGGVASALIGLVLVLALIYFSVSAPSVIARWTEFDYAAIALAVVLLAASTVGFALVRPRIIQRIGPRSLLVWNLAFAASLTGTLLSHTVHYPDALDSPAVVIGAPTWGQGLVLALMLLFSPVLYIDGGLFMASVRRSSQNLRRLALGILAGAFALVLLVFANIFTNVWGYVKPISPFFRGKYWLPFLVASLLVAFLAWGARKGPPNRDTDDEGKAKEPVRYAISWVAALAALCSITAIFIFPSKKVLADSADADSFRVMTYNTQQFNDKEGEKSVDRQLALVRKISPDLLALQESDSTRISLNNNDYVRYFAEKLGYYSYFGPSPVAGSFGTAILSKYPLENTRSAYIYSDKDETGIAEAEIVVAGRRVSIYDVHPDSSDPAMMAFAEALLERSKDKPYAIALGDYNLRDYEEAYKLIDGERINAWTSVYPSEIGADGVDMSGEDRIDHIFVSRSLGIRDPRYVKPPDSATDHAVHWTDLYFKEP